MRAINKNLRVAAAKAGAAKRWHPEDEGPARDLAAERIRAYVERVLATAPALKPEQRRCIAALLRGAAVNNPTGRAGRESTKAQSDSADDSRADPCPSKAPGRPRPPPATSRIPITRNRLKAGHDSGIISTLEPVDLYLRQIGKITLLDAQQEVELAKRIEAGLFAEERLSEPPRDVWRLRILGRLESCQGTRRSGTRRS